VWPGCPSWLQFKSLIDLTFQSVYSERRRSIPLCLLAKPVDSLFVRDQTAYAIYTVTMKIQQSFFNNIAFSVCEVFISSHSTVRGVLFTCSLTSLITCIQFRLFIKKYLTTDTNYALIGRRWSFLSILVKTAWFCCKRLQNDDALNFVHFFWTTLYKLLFAINRTCMVCSIVGPRTERLLTR